MILSVFFSQMCTFFSSHLQLFFNIFWHMMFIICCKQWPSRIICDKSISKLILFVIYHLDSSKLRPQRRSHQDPCLKNRFFKVTCHYPSFSVHLSNIIQQLTFFPMTLHFSHIMNKVIAFRNFVLLYPSF